MPLNQLMMYFYVMSRQNSMWKWLFTIYCLDTECRKIKYNLITKESDKRSCFSQPYIINVIASNDLNVKQLISYSDTNNESVLDEANRLQNFSL